MKQDFSGEWVLDRQASSLSPGADAVRSARLRITHRDPNVRMEGKFEFEGNAFEYSMELVADGREVVSQDGRSTTSLRWENDALLFLDRTNGPDSQVTMSWRYELQEGGRRLVATEQIRGGGRDQDNSWVFECVQ
jgi:hypothetical protein